MYAYKYLVNIVGDLNHDDGEGDGEPGHPGEEGDRAQQSEGPFKQS